MEKKELWVLNIACINNQQSFLLSLLSLYHFNRDWTVLFEKYQLLDLGVWLYQLKRTEY